MNKLNNFLTLHLAGTIFCTFLYAQLICAGTPASDKPKSLLSQSQTNDSPFSQETHQPPIGSRFTPMQGTEKFIFDSDFRDNLERVKKDYDAFGDDIAAGSNLNTLEGFEAELIKSSKPPGRSGGASHDHNNIPTSVSARQVLLTVVDSGHQHPGTAVREDFFEHHNQLRRPVPLKEDLLSSEQRRRNSISPSSRIVRQSSDVAVGDRQDVLHEVGMNDGIRDGRLIGAEKIRTSKPPGSGEPSHRHNTIPDAVSARQVFQHSVETSRHGCHPSLPEDLCDPIPMEEEACICFTYEIGVDAKLSSVCMMNQTLGSTRDMLDWVHKVGHEGTPDGKFGEELRKGSKPLGSGGSSRNHNSFPDSMFTDQVSQSDHGSRPQPAFIPTAEDLCGQGEGRSSRTHDCQAAKEVPRIFPILSQLSKLYPEHQQIVDERAHHQDGAAERVVGNELIKTSNPPSSGGTSRDHNRIIASVDVKQVQSTQNSPETRILHDIK